MSMSLREQLLQAGLGSKKQAKQAEQQQRQQSRNRAAPNGEQKRDEQKRAAQAQAAKAARDQELNRLQQERAEKKARWAQIKQLIEGNRLPKVESDEYFNFVDRQKVRRIAVDAQVRDRLIRGEWVIVRCEGRYDLVPAEIAARIREREERAVVSLNASESSVDQDDPYKDYVVPDDLKW